MTWAWPTFVQLIFGFKSLNIADLAERQLALTVPIMAIGAILTVLKGQLPVLESSTLLEKYIQISAVTMFIPLLEIEEIS